MQIRAGGQRINDFVGEPVGQELVQPRAELFPAPTPVLVGHAIHQEFELRVARAPESRNIKHHAPGGLLGDTHDAPDQTLPCAPEVQQRCVALRAHLILQAAQGREPLAVFAHLGRARGTHRRQSAFEFSSQLHAGRL